ncbi:MAG TPA: SEC-C metal-binding domain-containing protein [Thermodesulfobacteriota bacterium]|nr:SEC-C metal-binding domain-containing protein [Thermodesulfobacteriota bacterium]
MIKVGRNDPCPCGSGKKYKMCCMGKENGDTRPSPVEDVLSEIRQAMKGQVFNSLEEAQAFTEQFMNRQNRTPRDEFHGLSPEQMHHILNFPFTSPQLVTYAETVDDTPTAPILTLFGLLIEAIGESGLKPTAKGNLPQKFCREAALRYWGEELYRENTRFGGINKEEDFIDLHVTRLVSGLAGLIRMYKGRFILSRECRRILAHSGMGGVFPRLFRAYVERYNWGYWDRFPEIPFIQRSFLFTLYVLSKYGSTKRPSVFYEDCYVQAFPMALNEVPPDSFWEQEKEFRLCYTLRSLVHFAEFLGLATLEPIGADKRYTFGYNVLKLPLLDQIVQFHLHT